MSSQVFSAPSTHFLPFFFPESMKNNRSRWKCWPLFRLESSVARTNWVCHGTEDLSFSRDALLFFHIMIRRHPLLVETSSAFSNSKKIPFFFYFYWRVDPEAIWPANESTTILSLYLFKKNKTYAQPTCRVHTADINLLSFETVQRQQQQRDAAAVGYQLFRVWRARSFSRVYTA